MEFWGIEVKPGETVKVNPGGEKILHLSQASIGDIKKDKASENVSVFVEVDSKKLVIGTLSLDKFPQISYDLVFEKEFGLSHGSKSSSVFFLGYRTAVSDGSDSSVSEFDFEEEDDIDLAPKPQKINGKPEKKEEPAKPATGKPAAAAAKSKAKVVAGPSKTGKPKTEDDDDDDETDDMDEDDDSDEDIPLAGEDEDDDDEDDDDEDEEDEETPKPTVGKKRNAGPDVKTPVPEKKAKLVSPASNQKGGDGKKGTAHVATPYPSKQAGKAPTNDEKSKQKTPKSVGTITCPSCPNKRFATETALQSHNKAKHGK